MTPAREAMEKMRADLPPGAILTVIVQTEKGNSVAFDGDPSYSAELLMASTDPLHWLSFVQWKERIFTAAMHSMKLAARAAAILGVKKSHMSAFCGSRFKSHYNLKG